MNTPTCSPFNQSTLTLGIFATERLPLAIYLHASQRMQFLGCENVRAGKLRFVFRDLENLGAQTELDFDRGAEVAATDLFASQKFLRRKMSEEIENRRTENRQNEDHKS